MYQNRFIIIKWVVPGSISFQAFFAEGSNLDDNGDYRPGFQQVRVRIHGSMARIEVLPEEFSKLIKEDVRNRVTSSFRSYGFNYVSMDLIGYRTGSMNEVIEK